MTPVKAIVLSCSGWMEQKWLSVLAWGWKSSLQLWQENLPSCWSGTPDTLLASLGPVW